MITTQVEYVDAVAELVNLQNQYRELAEYAKTGPYIGRQMARDILRLTADIQEYDRSKKLAGATENKL